MPYDLDLYGFAKTPIWDVLAPDFAVGMEPGVYTGRNRHFSTAEDRVRAGPDEVVVPGAAQ